MAGFTATTLITSIRRRASIPDSSVQGSADSDLLAYANEELQFRLVAELLRLREEYYARDYDYTISSSTTAYRIPPRAIGGKLRHALLLDSSGAVVAKLPRAEPEAQEFEDAQANTSAFLVRGNYVVLVPTATTTATTLRLGYYLRPSDLTATAADYKAVTGVSSNVLTVGSGHGFTTSSVCDVVKYTAGYEPVVVSVSPSATASTTVTFGTGTGLTGLGVEVGDYVCTAEKSPVPHLPPEFHPLLAQRAACRYLEAAKDQSGLTAAKADLKSMEEAIGLLTMPRVDTSPQKIAPRRGATGFLPWRW